MIVVTGNAPRAGTSAMMRALIEHYEPHSYAEQVPDYVAPEKNPEGYWDVAGEHRNGDKRIPYEKDSVIKLWAHQFHRVQEKDVDLVVLMWRNNFLEQIQSIYVTAAAQGLPPLTPAHISQMYINQKECLAAFFGNTETLIVPMEEFREEPEYFVGLIKEVTKCQ